MATRKRPSKTKKSEPAAKKASPKKTTKKKAAIKKPAKKPAAEKKSAAKKEKPTTGQSAPKREISLDVLNDNEDAVLDILYASKKAMSVAEIAEEFGAVKNVKLRVRNAMRRLVQGDWVERKERATYAMSTNGRRRLKAYYAKSKAA